ncbi:MAG: alkaline shock response membrane anchor protein AmaP [Selenomonadaceae bacterium]|nr:alkaline shock response membrane anchor protein AmaP [Selenomonadaceae bacterium]
MGVGNRLLLALYALATMALTVALAGILVPILPEREWLNEVRYVTGRPEVLAGIVVYFLVGVHLFLCAFATKRTKKSAEVCLLTKASGRVHVSLVAIQSVVLRVARGVSGVCEVAAKISPLRQDAEETLRIGLKLTLRSGVSVRETADAVSELVRRELAHVLGMEGVQIEVEVAEISDERSPQRPRVS